jgi:hypothetical protein
MTVSEVHDAAKEPLNSVIETVEKLSQAASKMPYYKFNNMWSRQMQGAVSLSRSRLSLGIADRGPRSRTCCSGAGWVVTVTAVGRSSADAF